jgi:hypothetical protein
MQSIALSPRSNLSIKFLSAGVSAGGVAIQNAVMQTDIEPETCEEPFS